MMTNGGQEVMKSSTTRYHYPSVNNGWIFSLGSVLVFILFRDFPSMKRVFYFRFYSSTSVSIFLSSLRTTNNWASLAVFSPHSADLQNRNPWFGSSFTCKFTAAVVVVVLPFNRTAPTSRVFSSWRINKLAVHLIGTHELVLTFMYTYNRAGGRRRSLIHIFALRTAFLEIMGRLIAEVITRVLSRGTNFNSTGREYRRRGSQQLKGDVGTFAIWGVKPYHVWIWEIAALMKQYCTAKKDFPS